MNKMMIMGMVGAAALAAPVVAQQAASPAAAPAAGAARTGNNASDTKATAASPQVAAVQTLETAYQLARWGRANKSAQALVVAARMLKETSTRAPESEGQVTGATGTAPARPELTAEGLLAEARTLAAGDRATLAQIAAVSSAASKGATGGPIRLVRDIPARGVWTGTFNANGGLPLRVAAVGDGDTDVDVELFDQNGNRVCYDTTTSYAAGCSMTPAWTGPFTLKVTNLGGVWTRTAIMTN